jgi:transcription initiation factor IIE alpha subunit
MNNEMANFIGIHMLNDGYVDGTEKESKATNDEGGLTFQCPKTGSHFEFMDLIGRMRNLKQKRLVIDDAIKDEDKRKAEIIAKEA